MVNNMVYIRMKIYICFTVKYIDLDCIHEQHTNTRIIHYFQKQVGVNTMGLFCKTRRGKQLHFKDCRQYGEVHLEDEREKAQVDQWEWNRDSFDRSG